MADTLESLEIEVKHSASGAADSIYEVTEAIRNMGKVLSSVLPQLRDYSLILKNLPKTKTAAPVASPEITPTNDGLTSVLDQNDLAAVQSLAQKAKDAFASLKSSAKSASEKVKESFSGMGSVTGSVLKHMVRDLGVVSKGLLSIASHALKINPVLKGISNGIKGIAKRAKQSTRSISNLLSSLKRIAFYRIIRSAIKAVTDAMQEGLEKAYLFSSTLSTEGVRFSQSLDRLTSAGNQMKGQLGSAFIALIAAVEPLLMRLIDLVTRAADAISQLISAFTGFTYLKAQQTTAKFKDDTEKGAKAAKEWRNQLLGFDEINRLEAPSDSGSSSGSDPMSGFSYVDTPINEGIKKFVDDFKAAIKAGDWEGAGKLLGDKINSLLPSDAQWQQWGEKLGYGLNGAIKTLYSALSAIDFQGIGRRLALFINSVFNEIDFGDFGRLLMRLHTSLWSALYGAIKTIDWKAFAKALSDFVMGALNELANWLDTVEPTDISKALKDFFGNVDYKGIGDALKEVLAKAFGILAEVIIDLLPEGLGDNVRAGIEDAILKTDFAAIHNILSFKIDQDVFGEKWAKFWWSHGDYAGKETIMGIINGSKEETPQLEVAMDEVGDNAVSSLSSGFSSAWQSFTNTVSSLWNQLSSWWSSLSLSPFNIPHPHFDWTYSEATGLIAKAMEFVGIPPTIPHLQISWYAQGGFPDTGSLYFASENGPELVGTMGNRNAVANNDQIIEGIRQGVYDAVSAAMAKGGSGDVSVKVYLDSREIKTGQQRLNRAMGVS